MVIRAGVDDRQMVSALGVNIQLTFAIAFFVGSALAGLGGAIGGSFASLGPGVDANWLLYSLVVVIIGGMGSLRRRRRRLAPARARLHVRGRLPARELHVLLDHHHVRAARARARLPPARTLRKARMSPDGPSRIVERTIGVAALVFAVLAPALVSTPLMSAYFVNTILTQALFLGIAAASLIFLSAYGGMVSLAQVAIFGIAGFALGNAVTNGNSKGLNLGWNPWWGVAPRHRGRDRWSPSSSALSRAEAPGSTS